MARFPQSSSGGSGRTLLLALCSVIGVWIVLYVVVYEFFFSNTNNSQPVDAVVSVKGKSDVRRKGNQLHIY